MTETPKEQTELKRETAPEIPKFRKTANIGPVLGEDYRLINTLEDLKVVCEEMLAAPIIAVDTETEGLDFEDIIVGICLSMKAGTGYYIPIRHEEFDGVKYKDQLDPQLVFEHIGPILEEKPCVGHNIKFDLKMLQKEGVDCNFTVDTMAIAKVRGTFRNNGLKFLVKQLLGHEMADLASLFPKVGAKKAVIAPKILAPTQICHYAVEDANWTLQLYEYFLTHEAGILQGGTFSLEMMLLPVVAEMEAIGLPVSMRFLEEEAEKASKILDRLEEETYAAVRKRLNDPEYTFSIGSNPQVAKLLFDELGMTPIERSEKTGAPSVKREILEVLAKQEPLAELINTHRTLKKLHSTYLYGLQDKVDSDGRIRGNFNQFGTESGRFSSSNPNLQNLPRDQVFYLWEVEPTEAFKEEFAEAWKVEDGKHYILGQDGETWKNGGELGVCSDGTHYGVKDNVLVEMWRCKTRNFVEASPNHYMLEADYSQVELRLLAGESQEETLLTAYAAGEDVHQATAAAIFNIPFDKVTKEQRHAGKTINFSLLYGMGAYSLSKALGMSEDEAQQLIDRYFENLSGIKEWIEATKQSSKVAGFSQTLLGRRRYLPLIKSFDRKAVSDAERMAVNFRIQGAAADVMKCALVRTQHRLRKYFGDKARLFSTVHDSMLVEVHDSIPLEVVAAVIKDGMENIPATGRIVHPSWPNLVADIKAGKSWADAEDFKAEGELTLPEPLKEELKGIITRKVALERDTGEFAFRSEEVSIFDMDDVNKPRENRWIVRFEEPLANPDDLARLVLSKKVKGAPHSLLMEHPDENGVVITEKLVTDLELSLKDEKDFRTVVGPCRLMRVLEDIDPDEVLRGVDFGL